MKSNAECAYWTFCTLVGLSLSSPCQLLDLGWVQIEISTFQCGGTVDVPGQLRTKMKPAKESRLVYGYLHSHVGKDGIKRVYERLAFESMPTRGPRSSIETSKEARRT